MSQVIPLPGTKMTWGLFLQEAWKWFRDPLKIRSRRQKRSFLDDFRKPSGRDPRWPGFTPSKKWRPYGEDIVGYYRTHRDDIPMGGLFMHKFTYEDVENSLKGPETATQLDDIQSACEPPQ